MDRTKIINVIFTEVLRNGIMTSKGDIMSDDPIEDKVYTKKIIIKKDYKFKNGVDVIEVVSVSLTCENERMTDASIEKVRINIKNRGNSWVNIFLNEAPDELIEFIYKNI